MSATKKHRYQRAATGLGFILGYLSITVNAQEAGWHYSPIAGEGDRAALGCAKDSSSEIYTCIAVRCEDDYSAGIYIHTSRPEGDAGSWLLTVDRENRNVSADRTGGPYGAKILGDTPWLLERLKQGTYVYLQPQTGTQPLLNPIHLNGSLFSINTALAYCAPRVPPAPEE